MRKINELIWHCTATPEGKHFDVKDIDRMHKQRGWSGIGYHKLVLLDGSVQEGRPESKIGAHVAGRNTGTIGYSYVGGVMKDGRTPKDTRTDAQKKTMIRLTKEAIRKYGLKKVSGHHDYAAKACPCFPARTEYAPLLNPAYGLMQAGEAGVPVKDPANLSQSRTMGGAGLGGVGVAGAGLSEVASQIEPIAYYSQVIMFTFLALTLLGVGIAAYARWDDAGRPLPWKA